MGILERQVKKRRQWGVIQHAVLGTVAVGGLVMIAAIAPNALQLLGRQRNKYRFANQTKTALSRLASKGYITFEERGDKKYARITSVGKRKLLFEQKKAALQLRAHKRWDKRWRVIIFDIPEVRRNTRDSLRQTMKLCGFYRLQDSVWLFTYDCEDFVVLLKADLKLGNAVVYMIVEKIENDRRIKEHFGFKTN